MSIAGSKRLAVLTGNPVSLTPAQLVSNGSAAPDPLRVLLRHCSPSTYVAASLFRQTRDPDLLPVIIYGVIERFVERSQRFNLQRSAEDVRLCEDLGLDSLTLVELVVLAEDALQVPLTVEDQPPLRTLSDLQHYLTLKLR